MKTGKTLQELATEVRRQQELKKDYVVQTPALSLVPTGGSSIDMDVGGELVVGVNNVAHEQIGSFTKIPKSYYERMREQAPLLLTENVNHWLHTQDKDSYRLVRTLDGDARAFLSNSYRPLDNADFMEAALPPLMEMGVEVMSCEVTDRRLYIKVVDQRIKKDLPKGVVLGKGHDHFRTICPALVLSNSEVGNGSLSVLTSVWEGGCSNLMVISERSQRKYHLGSRMDVGEDVYRLLSDETRALTDQALWSQIKDVVGAAFDQAQFDALSDKLIATTQNEIKGDPVKVVEVTAKKFGFTDEERGSVLNHLIRDGDLSQYGLQAAITRAAQDVVSYDRASEMERVGGQVIELKPTEWRELAKAA